MKNGAGDIESIERRLVHEVSSILCVDPSKVSVDVPLPSLGLDSMGFVEILVVVEKTFGLKLIESGLTREDFQTIRSLAARISKSTGS